MNETDNDQDLVELTAGIVAAYVGNNATGQAGVPELIRSVHVALVGLSAGPAPVPEAVPEPAVPVRRSVTPDHIVCLEDGKKLKSMKRHLSANHGLTPDAYRAKWGLKADYPMVAPNYAATRSELARKIGLGRKPAAKPVPKRKARSPK